MLIEQSNSHPLNSIEFDWMNNGMNFYAAIVDV